MARSRIVTAGIRKAVGRELKPLHECARCGSSLVQPIAWKERSGTWLELELRCPECFAHRTGRFAADRVRELDTEMRDARRRIREAHDALVTQNMRAMLEALEPALQQDLIGADDFAPRA